MQQSIKLNIFCLFWLACSISACDEPFLEEQGTNLARVGDQHLTIEQAKEAIPSFIYREDSIQALQQYRQQWIQEQLLLQEAQKLDLTQQQSVQQKIERAREEILKEALRSYIITSEVDSTISDQEAQQYFEEHQQHFVLQEPYVRYRHLQTDDIADARAAQQALRDSVAWSEVARQYDLNPEQAIQSSQRYYPLSMALPDVDIMQRYLGSIGTSDISAIQRVNGIYHFVQLTGKREKGDTPDVEWLMDEVKSRILLEKRQRKFNSYLKNLYLTAESDNEIASYNVLPPQTNPKNSTVDTLESNSTDE